MFFWASKKQALQSAVQPKSTAENRLVLLHCDQARWARCDFLFCGDVNAESSEYVFELSQGHNRSPTLALTFFLHNGHTLRQACGLQLRETFFTAQSFSRDAVIVLMSSCFGTG